MLDEEFLPAADAVERGGFGDIEDEDDAVGVLEVGGDEAAVALLSGSVPHLQSEVLPVLDHVSDVEVDADGVLNVAGGYVVGLIEAVGGVAIDDGALADALVP